MAMDAETDRLIGVATRMFAELGYDWTSMRLIADAAGVDVERLTETVGDKPELYRQVIVRAHEAERDAMQAVRDSVRADVDRALDLADAYLDFYVAHPDYLALWLQRWTGDAADTPDLQDLYTRPLFSEIQRCVQQLTPPDVDSTYLIWTVVWCVYGFLSGSAQRLASDEDRPRHEPPTSEEVESFRAYLHALIRHMTTPIG